MVYILFDNTNNWCKILDMYITTEQKIRIEFIKKGVSGAEIGRNAGVSRDAISKTVKGQIKSRRLRKAVADAIGMVVEDIWTKNGNGDKSIGQIKRG